MYSFIQDNINCLIESPDNVLGPNNIIILSSDYTMQPYTFGFINTDLLIYQFGLTHYDLYNYFFNIIKNNKDQNNIINELEYEGIFIYPKNNLNKQLINQIKNNFNNIKEKSITGRVWKKLKIISFWDDLTNIKNEHINLLKNGLLINPNKYKLDIIQNNRKLMNYNDMPTLQSFINNKYKIENPTNQKLIDLLKLAHTNTSKLSLKEKEKIKKYRGKPGSLVNVERAKKLGFNTTAEYLNWLEKTREGN